MAMLSLDPATTTDGLCASIATAGSFCLFCENGDGGLPTVSSVPVAGGSASGAATAVPAMATTTNSDIPAAANFSVRIGPSLLVTGPLVPTLTACLREVPSLDPSGRVRQGAPARDRDRPTARDGPATGYEPAARGAGAPP